MTSSDPSECTSHERVSPHSFPFLYFSLQKERAAEIGGEAGNGAEGQAGNGGNGGEEGDDEDDEMHHVPVPVKSVLNRLKPSENRYTLINNRDEL